MQRRSFLKTSSVALVGVGSIQTVHLKNRGKGQINPTLSLNAYSFNKPLLNGEMGLKELFQFAVQTGFKALDLTAYYIPGYPEVPGDEVLFGIKKMAFRLGLSISGTGVRNDFTVPYAITWQVKENVMNGDGSVPTDFKKLMQIVTKHPYHGYFPLETLGEGNPRKKVKAIFQAVTKNFVQ